MHEIIRKIYQDLTCPVCGQNYKISQLTIKGLADKTLAVQTVCSEGHATLFMTTLNQLEKVEVAPISSNDVIDIHQSIKKFNGDFEKIWKK